MRQLKRHFRSKSRLIGSLGYPVLILLALGFGFGPIYAKAGAGNYLQFIGPGVIAMGILFTAIFSGIELIWDRQFGFLKETLVAPVSRFSIMLGRTLGGATIATTQGIFLFIIAYLVGFRPNILLFFPALIFMFLIALLFTALGTAIACRLNDMQAFPIIMNFLVMPMFFLSGALFPLEQAPRALQIVAMFDPMAYGVDGLRFVFSGAGHFGLLADTLVLIGVSLALLWIGSALFKRIQV
jgi:ABC-2 type transport system permease protein